MQGVILNTQYPVTCGNYITKWHYCYYTNFIAPQATTTLSMTVAVWYLNETTNINVVYPRSIRTITQQPVSTQDKIFCVEEALNETDYIPVQQGDIIGVVLPLLSAIPIVSYSHNSDDLISGNIFFWNPTNINKSYLWPSGNRLLHLYASLGK